MFVEPDCIIRGDLAHVRVGRFSIVKELFARHSLFSSSNMFCVLFFMSENVKREELFSVQV